MTFRQVTALLLGITAPLVATGCSSLGNHSPGLPSLNTPASAIASKAKKQHVRFVIRVPRKPHHGRGAKYLSPATRSMRIVIALGGQTKVDEVVGLTTNSNSCTSTAVTTNCELNVALGVGNGYIASFTTYDGSNGTGKVLSVAANTVFNVLQGQTTVVGLILNGVPASLEVFPAGANAFYAVALDGDGNIIVGPGAPTLAVNASGANIATIHQPTAAQPNTVSVAATAGAAGNETLGITANYPLGVTNGCAAPGAVCTFPNVATLHNGQELFLANYYDETEPVYAFTAPLTGPTQAPDATINAGAPGAIAADPLGNLFIATYAASGSLLEYSPPYTAVTAATTGVGAAVGLAIAPDGTAAIAGASLAVSSPPHTAASTAFTGLGSAVAMDANDNSYVTTASGVDVFSPPYTAGSVPKYTITLASVGEPGILVSANKLYVGERTGIEIFSLPISMNNPTPVATLTSGVSYAYGLVADAAGNLYVANYYGGSSDEGSVLIFNNPQTTSESPSATISVNYYPQAVALDKTGNLYVSTYEGGPGDEGSLQEFRPPFSSSSSSAVTISQGIYYPFGASLAIGGKSNFSMTLNQ